MNPETIIEQLPEALILADPDGRIVRWNAAATRLFGFAPDAALGSPLDIIIPTNLRDAHWRGFRRAVGERRTRYAGRAVPTRALRADGREIYVELAFAVLSDDDGEPIVLATARDITERFTEERANRRRLRELEARLEGDSGPTA